MIFSASAVFAQPEMLKTVVNNLALYKQKKDLKYLTSAKKSVDSLIVTHKDSQNLEKNVYRAVVYSSIIYADSTNKLNNPPKFFDQTTQLVDRLSADKKIYRFQSEIDFAKHCLANVFIHRGFKYINKLDYRNGIVQFKKAQQYAPDFKQINAYIAYCNSKTGSLVEAAKYYDNLLKSDSSKAEYYETAANIYKSLGDTTKALETLQRGRKNLPNDHFLLLDLANIYNNNRDYKSLEPLLPTLLDNNTSNADVTFVAANCYDHLGQYGKAESLYLHAIELNSVLYDPVYNLGLLYLRETEESKGDESTKNWGRAEQWLKKANEISPNDTKCLELLKILYAKAGDKEQINRVDNQLKQLTNP